MHKRCFKVAETRSEILILQFPFYSYNNNALIKGFLSLECLIASETVNVEEKQTFLQSMHLIVIYSVCFHHFELFRILLAT